MQRDFLEIKINDAVYFLFFWQTSDVFINVQLDSL